MNIHINPFGALILRVGAEDGWAPNGDFAEGSLAQDLAEKISTQGNEVPILEDLLEPFWTNGSFAPFDAGQANPFVGLTEAPCIAEFPLVVDDLGGRSLQPGSRLWWYPGYCLSNPVQKLLERGEVIFDFGFTAENADQESEEARHEAA